MKITRLLEITTILLNRKTVTAKELAARFNVSTRTIYRDIDALSFAGVPVYMNKGHGGGISLLEEYTLSRTLLSENESEGLFLALKTMSVTRYPEIDIILDKIGSLFKNCQNGDWISINFADWSCHPNEGNKFSDIRDAIINKIVIGFDYINVSGDKSTRFAEPEKLIFNTGTWYLIAYCLKRDMHRIFRLSRMKDVHLTDRHFIKRETPQEDYRGIQGYPTPFTELKLRFTDKVLNRLYDDFDEHLIHKNPAGSYDVTVSMPENEWLYGYILSFGHYVEVIEPAHIRKVIVDRIKETLKNYKV
ncbi:MAG: YafY family transcriptional regulator [Peptococcaceae bacterium]|nr:YafY family transcriptional regulator [Peptococcaceae bacterium]